MANVMFKRGTQANLNALKNYIDGCFYLTTDTDRLYVAQGTTELVELNKSITIIDYVEGLPQNTSEVKGTTRSGASHPIEINGSEVAVGQFYYVKAGAESISGNILAVCSAINTTTGHIDWTQVNPDTNTNDDTANTEVVVTKLGSGDNGYDADYITYKIAVKQQKKDKNGSNIGNENELYDNLAISKNDLVAAAGASVGVKSSAYAGSTKKVTVEADGVGIDSSKKFTIEAGSKVDLSESTANNIKINATDTTYTLSSADVNGTPTIKLTDSDSNIDNISIIAGTNININDTTPNSLTFNHAANATTGDHHIGPASNVTVAGVSNSNSAITFSVPYVGYDNQGHVTNDSGSKTITINPISTISVDNDDKGKLVLTDTNTNSITSDSIIYNTIDVYSNTTTHAVATINNQDSIGAFYSKDAIDAILLDKFNNLNALIYRGTVGSGSSTVGSATLPSSNVAIGDTYLVDSDVTIVAGTDNIASDKGDLYIATAKVTKVHDDETGQDIITVAQENSTTGYLATADIHWTRVESGGDTDTTYVLSAEDVPNSNQAQIKLTASTSDQDIITIEGDSNIVVDYTNDKLAITHKHIHTGANDTTTVHGNKTVSGNTQTAKSTMNATYDGTIIVPAFTFDAAGHIASVTDTQITLPSKPIIADTFSNLTEGTAPNTIQKGVQIISEVDNSYYSTRQYISDTLTIRHTDENSINKISFELEWGSF